jgi:hypothetical protein
MKKTAKTLLKPIKLATSSSAAAAPQSSPATVITAKVDVGFGNTLYVRGEGPGLSWNEGVPLDCVGSAEWTVSFKGAQRPVVFKLLINDESWSSGENFTAAPGARVNLAPAFYR